MAKKSLPYSCSVVVINIIMFVISRLIPIISIGSVSVSVSVKQKQPWQNYFLPSTSDDDDDISSKLCIDKSSLAITSTDFGNLVHKLPAAVFYPSSVQDIISLLKFSYNNHFLYSSSSSSSSSSSGYFSFKFKIAARGRGHSCRGQAMAQNGIVIDMTSLSKSNSKSNRIRVSYEPSVGFYADVDGEQLWIDVLHAALEHGVAPVSWTDYLYLTVGGTLSNAGISGQAFRYGPQITNVLQMDVVTGKGELISCSKTINGELFNAVLGGLGQFGIITTARIKLEAAPIRVKWVRMLYEDFGTFTRDQEHLISRYGNYKKDLIGGINNDQGHGHGHGVDYVEGSVMIHQGDPNNWRSSFFSSNDQVKITSLNVPTGMLYCLEVAKYYYHHTINNNSHEELERQLEKLNFIPGYIFTKEVTLEEFLNRVRKGELELQSKGLWDVPHPWLNIFIPRSQIHDFYPVITHIIAKDSKDDRPGPILIYPLNRNKWDDRMSAVIPEEEMFYTVGLLHSSGYNDWKALESKNEEILRYCDKNGIKIKQYLPHYTTKEDWKTHFGSKWEIFLQRKTLFDPKFILSPGQNIFD